MEGFRPLHDEQEGRFRTASLHPPAAPSDHHHRQPLSILPACGVATKAPPCALVAFVAVQATQPRRPAGRSWCMALLVVIEGWSRSHALLARLVCSHRLLDFSADAV